MGNKTRNTSNLVSDNNIFVDISNDRVGIGSTQPTTKLDVVGTVKATSFSGITTAMISDYGSGLGGGYSNTNVDSHINVGTANTGEVLSWNGTDYDWVVGVNTSNINADTLNVSGNATFQSDVLLGDSDRIILGADGDLKILSNNIHSYISNYSGQLMIEQEVENGFINIRNDNGSGSQTDYIVANGNSGEVELYYYGSKKLATKSTGIDVTGHIEADTINVSGA